MIAPPISPRTAMTPNRDLLNPTDHFVDRHIGPRHEDMSTCSTNSACPPCTPS
jgi:hypothetical protein